jgi:type VI secretion system secreted protein Hcp
MSGEDTMRSSRFLISAAATAVLALGALPARAAVDAYLTIGDTAAPRGHQQVIEVASWSLGASNPTSVGSGGMSAGKVSISSFNVMRRVDPSSPVLARAVASGKHFASVTLTARKAGGEAKVFEAHDVSVVSITPGGGGDTPMESVSFNYTKIEMK